MRNLYDRVNVRKTKTNSKEFTLNYYITSKVVEIEGAEIQTYGISIIKNFRDEKKLIKWEKANVNNICIEEDKIYEFAEKIALNRVTPIHLLEIAEDYVAECEEAGASRPLELKLVC